MTDTKPPETVVFPTRTGFDAAGEMLLGGVPVTALAAHYGTPLYVVDEAEFCDRAAQIKTALCDAFAAVGTTARVYYASKAFLCVAAAQWADTAGLGVDVASGGELTVALAAGVPADRIGVHGNNKSRSELRRAILAGVGSIVVDSGDEIHRLAEVLAELPDAPPVNVMLRVNSGVHAATHSFLATSHEDQKFGVSAAAAPALVERLRAIPGVRFKGLHCHIGSQIFAPEGFAESAKRLVQIAAQIAGSEPLAELNLGGGFGIAYTPAEVAEVPEIADLARAIAESVRETCAELGVPLPRIAFEPGRWIAGPAGVTLYSAGNVKDVELPADIAAAAGSSRRRYLSVDGGMSDNARPALYDAAYTPLLANRRSAASSILTRVVGKHCESGDVLIDETRLPEDIAEGDLLAVAATGAYCWSLSSNYNYLPRPAVVAVRDGRSRLIVRGETETELLQRSVIENENGDK